MFKMAAIHHLEFILINYEKDSIWPPAAILDFYLLYPSNSKTDFRNGFHMTTLVIIDTLHKTLFHFVSMLWRHSFSI